jgi:hypothetical protein
MVDAAEKIDGVILGAGKQRPPSDVVACEV